MLKVFASVIIAVAITVLIVSVVSALLDPIESVSIKYAVLGFLEEITRVSTLYLFIRKLIHSDSGRGLFPFVIIGVASIYTFWEMSGSLSAIFNHFVGTTFLETVNLITLLLLIVLQFAFHFTVFGTALVFRVRHVFSLFFMVCFCHAAYNYVIVKFPYRKNNSEELLELLFVKSVLVLLLILGCLLMLKFKSEAVCKRGQNDPLS